MRRQSIVLATILGITGCQLVEVVLAPGERTLVVQSVIDRSLAQQLAVLEYSTIGDTDITGGGNTIPPGRPRFAVGGAVVTVEHLSGGACPGLVETLTEAPVPASGLPTGRYTGALTCLGPGEPLALRVITPAGELVTGETVIPSADMRDVRAGASAARFALDTVRFDRDRDTLRVTMATRQGRGMQIEVRRLEDHDDISVIFINDSLAVGFPGNLVNPFDGDSGKTTFRAGAYYLMTVALADSNYFNFARTFSDPITGRGFLNHLKGGLGVFGSIETTTYVIRTVGTVNDPREGTYRITGTMNGSGGTGQWAVDATVELYLDDLYDNEYSALVGGAWQYGPVAVSVDSRFGPPGPDENSIEFSFAVRRRVSTNPAVALQLRRYLVRGVRSRDGTPFTVNINEINSNNGQSVRNANLTATQITGPGAP